MLFFILFASLLSFYFIQKQTNNSIINNALETLFGISNISLVFINEDAKLNSGISTYEEELALDRARALDYIAELNGTIPQYSTWFPIDEEDKLKANVTIYNEDLAFKGVNIFYSSENVPGASLY